MPTEANPLFEDLGISAQPAGQNDNPLFADLGISKIKASTESEDDVSAHPVTEEVERIGKNIVKQLPRNVMTGFGKLADLPGQIWDSAFHPDGDEAPTDIGTSIAGKASDKLEQAAPSLKPVNQGPIERIVGAGFQALPSAALGGPEAIVPTMASGAASQTAKEMGGGPVVQFAAGLAPFAPAGAAAAVRGAIRGGDAATTTENINAADQADIKLSTGQATDNPTLQGLETLSTKGPGGAPLKNTRGAGLNQQVEESVSNIVKKLAPDLNQRPPTPTAAGETINAGVANRLEALGKETTEAKEAMEQSVGGKDRPMSAPKLQAAIDKVTGPTGVQDVDNLVTGAKTRAVAKVNDAVTNQPRVPTSYSTDGEGAHTVTSPNGETHAVETAQGDLKVTRSDTSPASQGQGEGTSRLETLAHTATGQGKSLVSDISVSPSEAAAYEKLGRRGWNVEKNPNAEVNPDTGNTISDSPKNPVYTVKAPTTSASGTAVTPNTAEKVFTGEWTYNPKTGKSEPVTTDKAQAPAIQGQQANLNAPTPYTFDSLRQLRTLIGRGIKSTRDPGQQGQLKQLYGAISDDLSEGVRQVGPEAESAYGLFNSVAKQNAGTQKTLLKAVSKLGGPEAVFKAAMSGSKDGATKIAPIMSSLDSEGQNLFRATVLHRLGRPGGASDAAFDANTFLTNWKGMSPEAKNMLFNTKEGGGAPGQLRSSLDSIGKTLDLLKNQGYVKSGLAKGVEQGTAKFGHYGMAGVLAIVAEKAGEMGLHIAAGNPAGAIGAATAGGAILGLNPIMSRVLTNPKTAAWLAQATKAPKGMMPVLVNQLSNMGKNDPDAKDLTDLIAQQGNQ